MIGGLQGENGDLNNKYLEALKWISQHATWAAKILQAESLYFARKGWFRG